MECAEAATALPGCVEDDLPEDVAAHLETCIHCQAEAVRYKRHARLMGTLADQFVEPPADLLESLLDSVIEDRKHRRSVRRKAAVGIGGLAIAAAGTAVGIVVHQRHKASTRGLVEIAGNMIDAIRPASAGSGSNATDLVAS